MIGNCPAPSPEAGLVRGLLTTVDCNIREGVQGGYNAFFGPGSVLAATITTLLTIYVALIGFRLLTGRTDLKVGDLPMIAIKLGAVVLLTTSWSSYQALVFNLLFNAPAELANSLLVNMPPPSGGAAFAGASDIFARLQSAFDQMTNAAAALANTTENARGGASGVGVGAAGLVLQAAPGTDPEALKGLAPVIQMRSALQGGPAFGATALWLSAVTMLISTLGLLILAKLMLGLLLAVGPLFVGMLLFDSTKGLFEGWLRTALGFALVPLATIVFLAGLLASLDPSMRALGQAVAEERYDIGPVLTILVIVLTFTAVFASVIGVCTRLVAGFRLPDRQPAAPEAAAPATPGTPIVIGPEGEPSRAARLAASLGGGMASGGLAGGQAQVNPDRRDARIAASVMASPGAAGSVNATTVFDRRTEIAAGGVSEGGRPDVSSRLGQSGRRRNNPVRGRGLVAAASGSSR